MDFSPEAWLPFLRGLPNGVIYLMLGLSALVENLIPPIPGDTIIAMGAFLAGTGRITFTGVYVSTTVGSLAGFLTLFAVGTFISRRFLLEKNYRWFSARDILRAEDWFRRYGYLLVLLNRFLPGARSVVSVAGGISRLRVLPVTALAFLSCAAWNGIWIFMGYSLGTRWELVEEGVSSIMTRYNAVMAILGGLFVLALILFRFLRKRR
ncbi:MAG: DedA family protein [Deltaproteobacteria bacterium]|nr:DedA family protein [Deltaproteobacteria bacterium]